MDSRYDYKQHEIAVRKKWHDDNTYAVAPNSEQLFTIDTPPPTVSGSLHIGHIFSYTQTDILARYKRLSGRAVFYPFGFDNNGLATERYVENKRNIRGYALPRAEFIEICLEESAHAEKVFRELWQSMGLSVDWNYTYSTIADNVRALAQESFIRLYQKKFVYRKNEPALYCPTCCTSVAQAELEDKEKASTFNTIAFRGPDGEPLLIGTTRPELLPSCVCLFYHPQDTRYQHLYHHAARVPIFGTTVPIFPDDKVDMAKGTGLVMCCTFGDMLDIEWFKKHNLAYKPSLNMQGRWRDDTGILAGLTASQARERVLKELKDHALLIDQKDIVHTVSVHERCKKEVEYIMLNQWFISLIEHKDTFIALADKIEWYPSFMKARYLDWVKNLTWDWCISRQRFYGVPFPVWHCGSCQAIVCADSEDLPIDPQVTLPKNSICPNCQGTLKPDTDVMDTWNISSLTPYICQTLISKSTQPFDDEAAKKFLPMAMRPQAHDIIRTWAFYTIVKSWMHNNTVPWQSIVISGHVLSMQKEKISKSQGNNPTDPHNLLEQYPADAIRYWTATGGLGHDIAFSETELKNGLRLLTKLWNAFRFLKPHIEHVDARVQPVNLGAVNEWILDALAHVVKKYKASLDVYEFAPALACLDRFFWNDFCDMYVELVKNQLFNPAEYEKDVVSATQWTLHRVGLTILELYAPYLPYITEALYGIIYHESYRDKSVHTRTYTSCDLSFEASRQCIGLVCAIVHQVRKLKSDHKLSLKAELSELEVYGITDISAVEQLKAQEMLLKGVLHVQVIHYITSPAKNEPSRLMCDDAQKYTALVWV